jgi:hypothetical protein
MFSRIDPGPCEGPCNTAADGSQAQWLDGGNGQLCVLRCVRWGCRGQSHALVLYQASFVPAAVVSWCGEFQADWHGSSRVLE